MKQYVRQGSILSTFCFDEKFLIKDSKTEGLEGFQECLYKEKGLSKEYSLSIYTLKRSNISTSSKTTGVPTLVHQKFWTVTNCVWDAVSCESLVWRDDVWEWITRSLALIFALL